LIFIHQNLLKQENEKVTSTEDEAQDISRRGVLGPDGEISISQGCLDLAQEKKESKQDLALKFEEVFINLSCLNVSRLHANVPQLHRLLN